MLEMIVLALLLMLTLVVLHKGVKVVPQGENWTVEQFGRYIKTLEPGLHLIIPFVQAVAKRVNVQEQILDIPEQTVITRDNAAVIVDGLIYYRVDDAQKAANRVRDLKQALANLGVTNIRAVTGEMAFDEVLSKRSEINDKLLTVLDAATNPWGTKVTRVEIRKVEPPRQLLDAMNLQMTAERRRRAAVAEAEGLRQAAIEKAEGEKQSIVLRASGDLEAAKMQALARERLAEAEAKAVTLVSEAATGANGQALSYFLGQEYTKAFAALAANPSAKTLIVPAESAAMSGAIGQAMAALGGVASAGAAGDRRP